MIRRMILPMVVVVACSIVVLLAATVKKQSEITITLAVSSLRVPLGTHWQENLLRSIRLESITLTNFSELEPLGGSITVQGSPNPSRDHEIISWDRIESDEPFRTIQLQNVTIQTATSTQSECYMVMSASESSIRSAKIAFSCPADVRLTAGALIRGACDACRGKTGQDADHHFTIRAQSTLGQEILVHGSRSPVMLGFLFVRQDSIVSDGFPLDDRVRFETVTNGQVHSTVVNGTIQFADYKDRSVSLSPGDFVRFSKVGDLQVRSLDAHGALHLTIKGDVSTLLTGGDPNHLTNRVPSWLEWCNEKEPTTLYVSGVVWLTGLIWGILKALQIVAKDRE